jgi:2'-5' RNA ligase
VTARFIGSVEPVRVAEIEAVMHAIAPAQAPFRAALGDVGTFGGKRKPRVAWIGLWAGWRELGELEVGLSQRLEHLEDRPRFGGPANRPAPPHITLARAVPDNLDVEIRRRLLDLRGQEWTAETLTLFRSHLGPGGSVYEELLAVPFGR